MLLVLINLFYLFDYLFTCFPTYWLTFFPQILLSCPTIPSLLNLIDVFINLLCTYIQYILNTVIPTGPNVQKVHLWVFCNTPAKFEVGPVNVFGAIQGKIVIWTEIVQRYLDFTEGLTQDIIFPPDRWTFLISLIVSWNSLEI